MNLLLIFAAGLGLVLLTSDKSKSSSSDSSDKKQDGYSNHSVDTRGTGGTKPTVPKNTGLKSSKCNQYQYEKDGKCITFWNSEIQTEITGRILARVEEFKQVAQIEAINAGLKEPLIPTQTLLCYNVNVKDNIVKASILDVFEDIQDGELPPKTNSPLYMKKLWELSGKVYAEKICKK